MAAVHREVERKYDVPDTFRLPALEGLGPVLAVDGPHEVALEATYFDTADHRLASGRTLLRRRTGGDDAGWHLKLPVGDGSRDEIREPLGGDNGTIPVTLAALARATARGDGLGPVARLRTARSVYRLTGTGPDGAEVVLAEVVDDLVTAEAFGPTVDITVWRELEVELVTGPPRVLDVVERLLLESGAVPSTSASKVARALGSRVHRAPGPARLTPRSRAGEVVGAQLRVHVAELTAQDPRIRLDEPDSVHQMRVATRRLRSLLATYRRLYGRSVTDPVRDELKWLGGVLGAARDAEVQRERLLAAAAEEPEDVLLGPVAIRIDTDLQAEYSEAHAAVVEALDGGRYLSLLRSLDALVTSPPAEPAAEPAAQCRAAEVLPRLVRRSWKRLRKAERTASAAAPEERAAALHEVRKSAKRARYAAEAVQPVFGRPAARFGSRMKALQTHLGELQDSVAAREVLRAMAARAFRDGESGFTYGRLHAREQAKGDEAVAGFPAAWSTASAPRLRRWLR